MNEHITEAHNYSTAYSIPERKAKTPKTLPLNPNCDEENY